MASFFNTAPLSPFEPPSLLHRVLSSPLKCLAQLIFATILSLRGPSYQPPPSISRVRLVCISDTHTHRAAVPSGNVLIHAGDLTNLGTASELQDQVDWLLSLPHQHKIVIAGNHDGYLDPRSRQVEDKERLVCWGNIHYLQHSSVELLFPGPGSRRLRFYGAPQIPQCGGDAFAYQYSRAQNAWSDTIPKDTDILITHTPPRHHLDLPKGLGCEYLLKEIWAVRPRVHIFGHVHAGYGRQYVFWDQCQSIYETLCAREERGVLADAVDVLACLKVIQLTLHGILGIIWSRIWGGDDSGGVMVNAALAYRSTGHTGNAAQVVDV